ncbi:hypothetical protein D9611_000889 [Ephemerocybe angulata]|uniref:Peptidase HMCES n=1 Tax=Ephemerocybe angulata TaxID=980116 RepID=A0A8H5BNE4_9AGAR|nr:hypothetical protein D9611_000889 [Tulosesus angulatus]
MSTRFSLALSLPEIVQSLKDLYDIEIQRGVSEASGYKPKYNVSEAMEVPIVYRDRNNGDRAIALMRYGLIPYWCKAKEIHKDVPGISLANDVTFWKSLKERSRCVVPCQGYYDIPPKSTKALPSYVRRGDSNLFLLAGLHSTATIHGETSQTFAIVMAPADPGTSQEHQPVILGSSEAARLWLNDGPSSWGLGHCDLATAHHNPSIPPLTKYTVPEGVKNAGVECPSFVNPIRNRPDGMAAFLKKGPSQSQVPVASTSNAPATMSRSFPTPVKGKRASKSRNPPLRSPTHSIAGSDDGTPADAGDASNPIVLDDSSEGEEESTYGDASNPIILDDSEAGEEESTYGVESVSSPADGGFDFATADDSSEEEYTYDDEGELPVA